MFNKQMVGVRNNNIVILNPPRELTKQDALEFAAWLVCLAEENDGEFEEIYKKVINNE